MNDEPEGFLLQEVRVTIAISRIPRTLTTQIVGAILAVSTIKRLIELKAPSQ